MITIKKDTTVNPISLIGEIASGSKGNCYELGIEELKKNDSSILKFANLLVEIQDISYMSFNEIKDYSDAVVARENKHGWFVPKEISRPDGLDDYKSALDQIESVCLKLKNSGVSESAIEALMPKGSFCSGLFKINLQNFAKLSERAFSEKSTEEMEDLFINILLELACVSSEWTDLIDLGVIGSGKNSSLIKKAGTGKKRGRPRGKSEAHQRLKSQCQESIKALSKDFNGTMKDKEVMETIGLSHVTYWKYKKDLRESI